MVYYIHSLNVPFHLFFTLGWFLIHCTVKFTYTESKTEENTSAWLFCCCHALPQRKCQL